ncbi:DUF4247 domain-containing protein [Brevibacillus sp. TJ4]|uniref:DUF4247 domain-containing protein n=1 Tax=Brevibacillus sp. TJ4 TaxID=3234853 RepID=UPI0037D4601E
MPHHWMNRIKVLLIPAIFLLAMAGAGGKAPDVGEVYALESVNNADGSQTSYVYRAENKTVPEVAEELVAIKKPDEISPEDPQNMFLVYSDAWYHLQQDQAKPTDTLVQVDSEAFVKNNYDISFLEAYFIASVLEDVLDGLSGSGGSYRGYSSKDVYEPKGTYSTPSSPAPPTTKEGTGSIFKRSDKSVDGSGSVGSGGSIFKRSDTPSSSTSTGTITRNSSGGGVTSQKSSPAFSPPKKSPPRTKVGGMGRITKRR